jgi:hypothetical protein
MSGRPLNRGSLLQTTYKRCALALEKRHLTSRDADRLRDHRILRACEPFADNRPVSPGDQLQKIECFESSVGGCPGVCSSNLILSICPGRHFRGTPANRLLRIVNRRSDDLLEGAGRLPFSTKKCVKGPPTKSTESCPLGHRRNAGDATQGHRPAAGLIRGSSASRPNRAQ